MIEHVAASAGYSWGYCMFQDGSSSHEDCPRNSGALRLKDFPTNNMWHLPIQHLPSKVRFLYDNASLFTVVRNPYSRVLSEYYYRCAFHKGCNDKINDAGHMNNWITTALTSAMECEKCHFFQGGHWTPQHNFIFDNNGQRQVDHILHTETLNRDLECLFTSYKLNISTRFNKGPRVRSRKANLTVDNFNASVLGRINKIYAKDFCLGDYKMLEDDQTPKISSINPRSHCEQ